MKNLFFAFLFLLSVVACSSTKKNTSNLLKENIGKITSQKWVAGVRGGGGGIFVKLYFKNPLNKEIQIQKAVFKNYEGLGSNVNDLSYQFNFITTRAGLYPEPVIHVNSNLLPDEIQIFYVFKGVEYSEIINQVKELPFEPYP